MIRETELLAGDIPPDPPEGFRLLPDGGGFNMLLGPLYGRMKDAKLTLGFRVSRRHLNPHRTCHGGVIASFADMQSYVYQHEAGLRNALLPTVNLTVDFLSAAYLGDWLEARTSLLRASKTLVFGHTTGVVGDRPVFRASCIYKVATQAAPLGSTLGDFFDTPEEVTT
jgi:uncharacterized protein (TIGR00369 family)